AARGSGEREWGTRARVPRTRAARGPPRSPRDPGRRRTAPSRHRRTSSRPALRDLTQRTSSDRQARPRTLLVSAAQGRAGKGGDMNRLHTWLMVGALAAASALAATAAYAAPGNTQVDGIQTV